METTQTPFLITRPGAAGLQLQQQLESAGICSMLAPTMAIRWSDPGALEAYRSLLESAKVRLIFVSVNAVEGFYRCLQQLELNLPAGVECIAVGPATAASLKKQGADNIICPIKSNSEALLELPQLQAVDTTATDILLLAAPAGRQLINTTLTGRGFKLHNVMVYQRQPLACPPELEQYILQFTAINSVFTSAQSLQTVLEQWPVAVAKRLKAGTTIVISSRLAERAIELGIKAPRIASGADNSALLYAIEQVHQRADSSSISTGSRDNFYD